MKRSLLYFFLPLFFIVFGSPTAVSAHEIREVSSIYELSDEYSELNTQFLLPNTTISANSHIFQGIEEDSQLSEGFTVDEEELDSKTFKKLIESSSFSSGLRLSSIYLLQNFKNSQAFCNLFSKSPKLGLFLVYCSYRL